MAQLTWHRKLEGLPLMFTVLTVVTVLIGGLLEFIPMMLIKDALPKLASVKPLTPLELAGRDLYIREGCVGCHSQMIRPFRDEIERYGDYSKPGESAYDHPFLWGSKRTGPDLAREGGKYPHLWHVRHLDDPRSTSPGSIMPRYNWLLDNPLDLSGLGRRLTALQRLGVPYTDGQIASAEPDARAQASRIAADIASQGGPPALDQREIVALVAYLQRLGTDLKGTATKDAQPSTQPLGR